MSHNYVIKRIISVVLSVCMVMSVALTALPNAATANAITKGVSLTDSEEAGYEVLTFSDFGIADGEILTASSYGTHYISDTLEGNLDKVLFRGKFVFPSVDTSKQFGNIYLGKAKYYGIVLNQDSAGNITLDVISSTTNKSVVENKSATNLTANSSVQLRGNSDLEIAISVKYENTTDTTTDLKIGVWINGTQTTGGYIYARAVALGDLTRCFHTTDYHTPTSVTVKSVTETEKPDSGLLADSEEANYEKLTFSDFGVADGAILTQGSGHVVSNVLDGDLNEVLFQGKYLFPALEQAARFGNIYLGKANYYSIVLTQDSVGNIMLDVISSATNKSAVENPAAKNLTATNTVELRNNPDLEIAISIKYENTTDTTTDLKIGVWLNGVLSGGGYVYAKAIPLTDLTRCFHTTDVDTKTSVTVASVGKTEEPVDVLLSESEEANYENLTFGSFGIADGPILTQGSGHVVSNVLDGDLNEVLFQGKYLFPTLEQAAKFGNIYLGKAKYYSIVLTQDSAGHIMLDVISSATNKSAVENPAAKNLSATNTVELRNNPDLEIAISIKYENTTDSTTDLKIGVWFNGVLSGGGYVYAKAIPLTDLTRCFHTTDSDAKTSVTVSSVGEVVEPEKILLSESEEAAYEKLTFANFGAKDGEILTGKAGEKTNYATLPGNLDGVLFQAKYVFPAMSVAKQVGNIYLGRPDWWAIGLTQDSAGNISLSVISDGSSIDNKNLCNLTAGNPTIQFRENEDLEIAISVKYENTTETTTDLKIGVWLNGVLQQSDYIYARNVKLSDLTRCLHTYDAADGCGVTITSVGEWEVNTLPVDFTEITLSDGNIPDGNTVTWGNFSRISSLDKTLFSANVQFNMVGSRLHLGNTGGAENAYSGLGLRLEKNGTLVLGNELASGEEVMPNELASIGLNFFVLNPALAGMGDTFAEKEFLLQISTEFVDYDGGGEANDIKLGIFINGALYCNNYVYIPNEAQTLATGVNFNGVNQVDFARFSAVVTEELTTKDLGMKNGQYSAVTYGTASTESLDRTAITANITFGNQTGNAVAFGCDGKGIVFTHTAYNTVALTHVKADGTVVDIAQLQMTANRAAEIRTTFEFIKAGEKTNLKLGVFVNGKLTDYQYYLVEDVDVSVLTRSISVLPSGSTIRIGANNYEELTLRDFIVADKTRSDYGGRFTSYGEGTYNNTAFSAVLTFSDETQQKNGNCFYIGGKDWAGFRVELDANGRLGFSYVHADGVQMKLANINPEDVGMTSFQGKAFTYRVTFDVVESAQGQLDAIIGVYVNDVLCQGKYMTVKGVDPVALERGLFSYIDKNGGSLTMKSTNPVVDFTIFGLNRNWESTLGIQ